MTVRFLEIIDVLEIHKSRIQLYGGSPGLRDLGMLQSAVAQPQAGFAGQYLHVDLFEMAAAYLFHLAMNHPFVDGNKRTALAACLVFLDLNGIELDADPDELEDLTVSVAQGNIDKSALAQTLRRMTE